MRSVSPNCAIWSRQMLSRRSSARVTGASVTGKSNWYFFGTVTEITDPVVAGSHSSRIDQLNYLERNTHTRWMLGQLAKTLYYFSIGTQKFRFNYITINYSFYNIIIVKNKKSTFSFKTNKYDQLGLPLFHKGRLRVPTVFDIYFWLILKS